MAIVDAAKRTGRLAAEASTFNLQVIHGDEREFAGQPVQFAMTNRAFCFLQAFSAALSWGQAYRSRPVQDRVHRLARYVFYPR